MVAKTSADHQQQPSMSISAARLVRDEAARRIACVVVVLLPAIVSGHQVGHRLFAVYVRKWAVIVGNHWYFNSAK
jgi:hypothetical protein